MFWLGAFLALAPNFFSLTFLIFNVCIEEDEFLRVQRMNGMPSRVLAPSRRMLPQFLPGSQGEFPASVLLFRGEVSSVGALKGKALVERSRLS